MKLLISALVVLVIAASQATASQPGTTVMQNWRSMDLCAREAQAAYPDFTAEANAKRDAKLKECLEEKNLPPRQLSPPLR